MAAATQLPDAIAFEPPKAALLDNKKMFGTKLLGKFRTLNMARYYDSEGKEIVDFYDEFTETNYLARNVWLNYWEPLLNKATIYNKAFKIFDEFIELKKYSSTKKIIPYQLKQGFKWVTSEDGKVIYIIEKETGTVMISKVLSDSEYENVLFKRKLQKRKAFIDKAMANEWTHWATLTFSSKLTSDAPYSYLEAKKAFMEWRKSVVRKYGYDFKYMAIAEYGGENHRIHWHVLLYFDKSIVFQQARSKKGKLLFLMNSNNRNITDSNGKSIPKLILPNWQYGITDFYPTYGNPRKVVNYIAKYMTKNEDEMPYQQQGLNAKSYLASQGLKTPQKEYLQNNSKSIFLTEENQKILEAATPSFKLIENGNEKLRKTEAVLDNYGNAHSLKTQTNVLDITKQKNHQPTSNLTDDQGK